MTLYANVIYATIQQQTKLYVLDMSFFMRTFLPLNPLHLLNLLNNNSLTILFHSLNQKIHYHHLPVLTYKLPYPNILPVSSSLPHSLNTPYQYILNLVNRIIHKIIMLCKHDPCPVFTNPKLSMCPLHLCLPHHHYQFIPASLKLLKPHNGDRPC